ncbi:MAG: ABC transporter ATP-binding protein [Bdellovibrionales bacterium]|nr:ABC transporter ATP-binding protein [Bdellovibrionales bacterium]MBT7668551.1 ABC transporter ATP-binding protein [Bdellovibrionales bacterium]MBT7765616.1 ABC transporter ATP-binding protein [Bdellovibrionales bacterium]
MQTENVFEINSISKIYGDSGVDQVCALDGVDLTIKKGEFVAVVGPSGSGKTTLLNIISGLDLSTSGRVLLSGRDITKMSGTELSDYRRDHIGFIFQAYNLIPVLTVAENVEYIMLLQGVPPEVRKERVYEILKDVSLEGKEGRFPRELSGGQKQRVAVARAIVSSPDIVLADEPTANLDSKTGTSLVDMMRGINESRGHTFVFSTHDPIIMERAKRLVVLQDGKIKTDEKFS